MNVAADTAVLGPPQTCGDETTPDNFGGKGFSLHKLMSAGLQVPPFITITANEFTDHLTENNLIAAWRDHFHGADRSDESHWRQLFANTKISATLRAKISAFVADHSECSFAVRSSSSLEDGHELSFAGQHATFLNVQKLGDILNAVQHCWASLFAERVFSYIAQQQTLVTPPRMAVVIQIMIPAEQSGVSFSINPTTGHDTHVIIEAVRGLGEGLVSGRITPDRYVIDWYREETVSRHLAHCDKAIMPLAHPPFVEEQVLPKELIEQPVLSSTQITDTTELCVQVQALYGFPVDIEWAWHGQQLWLLQARPITTIQMTCTDQQWTTANFRDGGVSSDVCTPFMWSIYDFIWERAMPSYLRAANMLPPTIPSQWGTMFFARPYWNVGAIKQSLALLPGFVEAEFDDDLGIQKNYKGCGRVSKANLFTAARGMRVLLTLRRSFKKQLAQCKKFQPEQCKRLQALDAAQPDNFSAEEFIDFYRHLINTGYYQSEGTYFTLIFNNTNYTALFREKLKKLVPNSDFLQLIGGLENISHLRQPQDLWILVKKLSQLGHSDFWTHTSNEELLRLYRSESGSAGMDLAREHVQRFKHHSSRELDMRVPRIDEDPTSIFSSIKQLLHSTELPSPIAIAEQQKQRFAEEQAHLLKATPILSRRRLRNSLTIMRELMWMREELRDMSTYYYYHIRRFTCFIGAQWFRAGKITHAEDIFFLTAQTIVEELEKPGSVNLQKIIARNKSYYLGFRNFKNPNDLAAHQNIVRANSAAAHGNLSGVGCSHGYVEGIARVVTSLNDADRLQQGDILVTYFTDPGWTLKFPLLKGIITETGGMLSHAAVIAREYGIPAVAAVDNATHRIRDGQRIAVDGKSGRIDLYKCQHEKI